MRSSNDICNIDFQKAVGGYKPSDVDEYLAEIAQDYAALQHRVAELESANAAQLREITTLKEDQLSVQNLLMNAQKLADKTIADAKIESEKIINDANAAVAGIMAEAEERVKLAKQKADDIKANSDSEMQKILAKAVTKSENMITAAHDSVARQQLLFDKLKAESVVFKKELLELYKKQLAILQGLPDEVPFDAQRAADALAFDPETVPDFADMKAKEEPKSEEPAPVEESAQPVEEPAAESAPVIEPVAEAVPDTKEEQLEINTNDIYSGAEPVSKQPDFVISEVDPEEADETVYDDDAEEEKSKSKEKTEKKKSFFFNKLDFGEEEEEEEDFEPRDLFGRKK